MPFGRKSAPLLWAKICCPVVRQLRAEGFCIVVYVDDFGGAPPTEKDGPATRMDVALAACRVRSLLSDLGFTLHRNNKAVSMHLAVADAYFRHHALYTAMWDHHDVGSHRVRLGR